MIATRQTVDGTTDSLCWSYDEAFCRHRGLLTAAEQDRLQRSRVAIAGMGGVGGVHLMTLARLGIGAFTIADPDAFELANFNRQYGANLRTVGRNKAAVMAEMAQAVNPEARLRVMAEAVTAENMDAFLEGADVVLDAIDGYAIAARRLLFREARRRGIWAITAGPIGFSTAWLVFSPTGMSFDEYFDLHDGMEYWDQVIAFAVGLTPHATQRSYFDYAQMEPSSGHGLTASLSCQLCAGVAAVEVAKIVLNRQPLRSAPWYSQFDPHQYRFCHGRLRWGNRHLRQRLRRWFLRRWLRRALADGT